MGRFSLLLIWVEGTYIKAKKPLKKFELRRCAVSEGSKILNIVEKHSVLAW